MLDRIRAEGLNNSKITDLLIYLCDVYAPRLPDSPQYVKAGEWIVGKAKALGLANAAMEPYGTFGRSWELQKFYAAMTEPQYMPIVGYPKAWTPGTNGVLKGPAVLIQAKTVADLDQYKGKLKDAIVLLQGEQDLPISFDPMASRLTEADLEKLMLAPEPGRPPALDPADAGHDRPPAGPAGRRQDAQGRGRRRHRRARPRQVRDGLRLERRVAGQGRGDARPGDRHRLEHYNRIVRILQKNIPVTLEIEVQARFTADDLPGTNVVAEIPGTDPKLKAELVMLGGHFDTWHAGTGATDDGAGCAVAFEAMRILKTLGVKPRRTIRMALWDAEESGFVGSRGYVANHFYDRTKKEKKPEYDKLAAYFNFDNGSGKIRGIYAQSNSAVVPIFEDWLKPIRDLGAATVTLRNTGGTDHLPFDGVGLPGFQFIQDDLVYDRYAPLDHGRL